MKIKSYKAYAEEVLLKKLRKVILLNSEKGEKPIFVYKNALIKLKKIDVRKLLPLQLYQLESSNRLILNLYKILKKKYNQDILNMNGYVTYTSDNKRYAFVPPIIEYVQNGKGKNQKVIIDGVHRVLLARKLRRKKITVIAIENVPQELNLPAAPNSWRELKLLKTAPEGKCKRKWFVPPEKGYLYYRNYQSVFQNIGKPRASKISNRI